MLVFRVFLNGKLISTAGANDLCVLSQTLTAVGKLGAQSQGAAAQKEGMTLELGTSGLTARPEAPPNVNFSWLHTDQLTIGDRITVEIAEENTADAPIQPNAEAIERTIRQQAALEKRRYESSKKFFFENKEKYENGTSQALPPGEEQS